MQRNWPFVVYGSHRGSIIGTLRTHTTRKELWPSDDTCGISRTHFRLVTQSNGARSSCICSAASQPDRERSSGTRPSSSS